MVTILIYNNSNLKRIPRQKLEKAVQTVFVEEKCNEGEVRIIFENDEVIHTLNREYLGHDYTTDVITFPLEERPLEGEIYISVDIAKIQAVEYAESLSDVLTRLAVHGALHLTGYDDSTDIDRERMNELETYYINNKITS